MDRRRRAEIRGRMEDDSGDVYWRGFPPIDASTLCSWTYDSSGEDIWSRVRRSNMASRHECAFLACKLIVSSRMLQFENVLWISIWPSNT